MTVENMKTGFVERIGGTVFVVNAMPAENAKHIQSFLISTILFQHIKDSIACCIIKCFVFSISVRPVCKNFITASTISTNICTCIYIQHILIIKFYVVTIYN